MASAFPIAAASPLLQDSVRLLAVENCVRVGKLLSVAENEQAVRHFKEPTSAPVRVDRHPLLLVGVADHPRGVSGQILAGLLTGLECWPNFLLPRLLATKSPQC